MVQQQYIIAELGDYDVVAERTLMSKGMHLEENKGAANANLGGSLAEKTLVLDRGSSFVPANDINKKLSGVARPALGIFGSLSSTMIMRFPDIADNLNL